AGPAANAAIAAALFVGGAVLALTPLGGAALAAAGALGMIAKINVGLALFNMLPLPQLDGGKVVIGLLPQRLYQKWIRNDRVHPEYRSIFTKLYEGPSWLLNLIGIDAQGRVNLATQAVSLGVFVVAALAGWFWLGVPALFIMLVCSYDYYCIREKIQN